MSTARNISVTKLIYNDSENIIYGFDYCLQINKEYTNWEHTYSQHH